MAATKNSEKAPDAHRELPSKQAIEQAGEHMIKDESGNEIAFKTLYTDKPADERQLIIFIRHFFCGSCELYAHALVRDLPLDKLAAAKTTLTIIGCGEPICIDDWRKRTGCPYKIYCDPKRQLHSTLGMLAAFRAMPEQMPKYHLKTLFGVIKSSTWTALSAGPKKIMGGGPAYQQGGEWLFQGGEVKWVHRMRNSADHAETSEVKEILGIVV